MDRVRFRHKAEVTAVLPVRATRLIQMKVDSLTSYHMRHGVDARRQSLTRSESAGNWPPRVAMSAYSQ